MEMTNALEIDKTLHTSEEKDDGQRAKDKFRMFRNAEGETVKIATSDEFITATGRTIEGKGLVQAICDVEVQ